MARLPHPPEAFIGPSELRGRRPNGVHLPYEFCSLQEGNPIGSEGPASLSEESTSLRLPRPGSTPAAIAAFFVVTVGLGAARFTIGRGLPGAIESAVIVLATLAPLIATVTVAATTLGRDGLRDLWGRIAHWRVHPGWYVLGLGGPVVIYGAVLAVFVAAGAPLPVFDAHILMQLPVILVAGPLFYLVEEIGWRGWLQRALHARTNPLAAALLVGVVWIGWHIPLFYVPDSPQSDISPTAFAGLALGAAVVFAWIFNATGGSVPAVVTAHLGFNLGFSSIVLALSDGANTFLALCAVPTALIAVAIVVASGGQLGCRN